MDFINVAVVFLFLQRELNSKVCADFFTSSEKKPWTEASRTCTLATPTLHFDDNKMVANINITITEDLWLGYFRQNTIFQNKGCRKKKNFQPAKTYTLQSNSPGLCASACGFYTGIVVGLQKKQCYCAENNIGWKTRACEEECDGQPGVACGDNQNISLYSVEDKDIDRQRWEKEGDCLRVEKNDVQLWADCRIFLLALCSNENNEVDVADQSYSSWITASNKCFKVKRMLANISNYHFYNQTGAAWCGIIRSKVIFKHGEGKLPSKQAQFMFITNNNEVKFAGTETKKFLCSNDPTKTASSVITSTSSNHTTAMPESHDTIKGAVVGVSITVVLVIGIVIAVVIFLRRRKVACWRTKKQESDSSRQENDGNLIKGWKNRVFSNHTYAKTTQRPDQIIKSEDNEASEYNEISDIDVNKGGFSCAYYPEKETVDETVRVAHEQQSPTYFVLEKQERVENEENGAYDVTVNKESSPRKEFDSVYNNLDDANNITYDHLNNKKTVPNHAKRGPENTYNTKESVLKAGLDFPNGSESMLDNNTYNHIDTFK